MAIKSVIILLNVNRSDDEKGTGVFFALIPDGTTGPIQQHMAGLNGIQSSPDGSAMVVGERGYGAWNDTSGQSSEENRPHSIFYAMYLGYHQTRLLQEGKTPILQRHTFMIL